MLDRSHVPARAVLMARKRMNDAIRGYFDQRGFLEVETPIAVISPGLEPHLEAFETWEQGPDKTNHKLYLHTSPEYAMKRVLARQMGSIYQLARVFRNGERSDTHAPEFTMLEWYRSPGDIGQLMDDTEGLIKTVAEAVAGPWSSNQPALRISISEAFLAAGLADPLLHPTVDGLRRVLGGADDDTWDDIFFRAYLAHVEPRFPADRLTLLWGYPAQMAALARLDPQDPRRAERFEAYVGKLELANAFGELSDPAEQRRRFEHDLEVRKQKHAPLYPVDEGLLAELPNIEGAAGIALGVDRLLMLCLGLERVQDVLIFSPREL